MALTVAQAKALNSDDLTLINTASSAAKTSAPEKKAIKLNDNYDVGNIAIQTGASSSLSDATITDLDTTDGTGLVSSSMEVTGLRDLTNDKLINSEAILNVDSDGVFLKVKVNQNNLIPTYQYIPASQVQIESSSTEPYESADAPELKLTESTDASIPIVSYEFGIDKVEAKMVSINNVSGFVSKNVEIESCSYIKLSAKTEGDGTFEYYIIDGSKVTPILPVEDNLEIKNEKVFPGLTTRFTVDASKDITVYDPNGEETDLLVSEVTEDGYTVSYTTKDEARLYYPNDTTIRVKVIERLNDGELPVAITSLIIERFGGTNIWTTLA